MYARFACLHHMLCAAGQLLQLRAEVSKYMRFVVSDKDSEQLAAFQVCTAALITRSALGCNTVPEWITPAKL